MKGTEVLFSSKSDEWSTPKELFEDLNKRFDFKFDLAASKENALCEKFFSIDENAIAQDWSLIDGWSWLNPPYSEIFNFVHKATLEAEKGANIVMLIPARVDTRWYHGFVSKYHHSFIKGRLKFSGAKHNAPFPCMLVFFSKIFKEEAA